MKRSIVLASLFSIASSFSLVACAADSQPGQAGTDRAARHAKLDTNGDGVIDRQEAAAMPRLAENFDRLDKNKDGRIDASERPHHGQRGADGDGGKERGHRMAQLDTNGDGRFSRDELAGKERLLQKFSAIDSNGDGYLSREEMQAYHQQHGGKHDRTGPSTRP